MKDVKIPWKSIFRDTKVKSIIQDYCTHSISFDAMKAKIINIRPSLKPEIDKMDIIGPKMVRRRSVVSLNANGSPISGGTHDLYFFP